MSWARALLAFVVFVQDPLPGNTAAPGTAVLRGRVTDAATGAPIPRAVVFARQMPGGKATQVLANDDGRYELTALQPGPYLLSVTAGEFVATHVHTEQRLLQLKAAEARELNVALSRGLAIEGRVLDEDGVPLARVRMRIVGLSGSFNYGGNLRETDDRGAYRVFGVTPGRYLVCAQPAGAATHSASSASRRNRFIETCYPSATEEEAQPVTVRDADAQGIDIILQRRPTFTISGTVVDASGNPKEPTVLYLTRIEKNGSSSSGQTAKGAQFSISDVVPGKYVVSARMGQSAPDAIASELGGVPVEITTEDVRGLVVRMKKPGRARGRITFEDGTPADLDASKLSVAPTLVRHGGIDEYARPVPVAADLTFELEALHGSQVLRVEGLPAGWVVRSIRYRSREVLDIPVELDGDPRSDTVDVQLTRRLAEISGRAVDATGNPARGARVYVFPVDQRRWEGWIGGSAAVAASGAFRVRNLLEGDYLIVAVSPSDQAEMNGARFRSDELFSRLARLADRITLLESDRRVADLRITPVPPEWKR